MKCKICSGPLKVILENKLAECPLCNTIYRLPFSDEKTRRIDKLRPLMHRAEIHLSDGVFDMAEKYFDKAIEVMPDCPTAHLEKCLARYHVKTVYELAQKDGATDDPYLKHALTLFTEPFRSYLMIIPGISSDNTAPLSVEQWIKETVSTRNELILALKKNPLSTRSAENIEADKERIKKKYQAEIDSAKAVVASLNGMIYASEKEYTRMFDYPHKYAGQIAYYSSLKSDLRTAEAQLNSIERTRNAELTQVMDEPTVRYNPERFSILKKIYPLTPLPDLSSSTITEKVYYICISTYEFLTFEDIRNHALFSEYSDRIIRTTLKKLSLEHRIETQEKDGITYYVPSDIIDVFLYL